MRAGDVGFRKLYITNYYIPYKPKEEPIVRGPS